MHLNLIDGTNDVMSRRNDGMQDAESWAIVVLNKKRRPNRDARCQNEKSFNLALWRNFSDFSFFSGLQ
jgi:hypothetical protein